MNTAKNANKEKVFFYIGVAAVILVYLLFYLPAIFDLSQKSYWITGDEILSHSGIIKIYQSASFSEFLSNITFGNDLRYGRIFWNISAITSYIPYLIWSDQGQIVATRLTQFLLLASAYLILVNLFIKDKYLALLAFALLILLPQTQYFANMPKPEPDQLFFFALFLYFAIKRDWDISAYIIFLGISLALKISLVPITGALLIFIVYKNRATVFAKTSIDAKKLIILCLGLTGLLLVLYFLVMHPHLQSLLSDRGPDYQRLQEKPGLLKMFNKVSQFINGPVYKQAGLVIIFSALILLAGSLLYKFTGNKILRLVFFVIAGVIICSPCLLYAWYNFKVVGYLIAANHADHIRDDASVNIFSWLRFIFNNLFTFPALLLAVFLAFPFVVLVKGYITNKKADVFLPVLALVIFLFAIVPIILTTKRLWPHYLHFGLVFFVLFYFSAIKFEANKIIKAFYFAVPLILLPFLFLQSKGILSAEYASRTKGPNFKMQEKDYEGAIAYLNAQGGGKTVVWDQWLPFVPGTLNKTDSVVRSFNFFSNWKDGYDFVVLDAINDVPFFDASRIKNAGFLDQYKKAIGIFAQWNPVNGKKADSTFYYVRVAPELKEFMIFKRENVQGNK